MACYLMAISHYLNQCWLIINIAHWHLAEGNFTEYLNITHYGVLKKYCYKNMPRMLSANYTELKWWKWNDSHWTWLIQNTIKIRKIGFKIGHLRLVCSSQCAPERETWWCSMRNISSQLIQENRPADFLNESFISKVWASYGVFFISKSDLCFTLFCVQHYIILNCIVMHVNCSTNRVCHPALIITISWGPSQ